MDAYCGTGTIGIIAAAKAGKVIGVEPVSYTHLVGAGAFVSEIFGDEADELRRRGGDGGEYGATTGRPRRMGWYDCVAVSYTHLDVYKRQSDVSGAA